MKLSVYLVNLVLLPIVYDQSVVPVNKVSPPKIKVFVHRNLPPDIHRLFNVTISFPFFHKTTSSLIVYLVNKTDRGHNLLDTFKFRPGSQTQLTAPFNGTFMSVPLCVSHSIDKSVELHIRFNSTANNKSLLIYYSDDYQPRVSIPTAALIYESAVSCNVSAKPHIYMTMGTNDHNETAFVSDSTIWINCSARAEHEPRWRSVRLEGLDDFDILKEGTDNNTLKLSIYTTATIKNHGKVIACQSMNHVVSRSLLIYHHPVSVYTTPQVNSWSSLPSNVSITCNANGGYPPPTIEWKMTIGPHNASHYYHLSKDRKTLTMRNTTPPGSKWIFECSAKNIVGNSVSQGPVLRIYSNVGELSLERRKIVIIIVPIIIVVTIAVICGLKGHCFKKNEHTESKSVLRKMPENPISIAALTGYQNFKLHAASNDNLSKDCSNSTYSIEAGIEIQSDFCREEVNDLICKCGSIRSLATDFFKIHDSDDATKRHSH